MKFFTNNYIGWVLFGALVPCVAFVFLLIGSLISDVFNLTSYPDCPTSSVIDTGGIHNDSSFIERMRDDKNGGDGYSSKTRNDIYTEYVLPYKLGNDGRAPYRSFSAKLWDSHPEYEFVAFEKVFHLVLSHPDNHFITKNFRTVTRKNQNESESHHLKGLSGCFYHGFVKDDATSSVAVSLCNGMTGHIRTRTGSYFIEPMNKEKASTEMQLHTIYRQNSNSLRDKDYLESSKYVKESVRVIIDKEKSKRVKRSMSRERYVELMVVTDKTMSDYHEDNLRHYVLTLMSIVALVYRDASIGNPINIALVQFHILKDHDFSDVDKTKLRGETGKSAGEMLRRFCSWQKEHNDLDDHSRLHHDTALLLTRETICRNPWSQKCDTLGLAELGTMCDHAASCAIVQDNGLSAAFTIAHELGHVMNMPHDDDYKCRSILGDTDSVQQHYVMSRMLDHNTYPWAWSRCSRHFLTEYLDTGHGSCLEDEPITNLLVEDEPVTKQQPGEIFSENKQCQLVFGTESRLCSYMPSCRRLWCTTTTGINEEESEGCRTQHMPWADGTQCGTGKWCQKGACVLKDLTKLQVIDGDWGRWQPFEPCSRTCGGGIKRSTRECDSPVPSNGGKYCVGPRVRYESCNMFDCPEHKDFRAEQCSQFDNNNFNINDLPKNVNWVPKYTGISSKDRCKLYCRVENSSSYYLLRDKVVDGTPCSPDTFDICVNGNCQPAGCDRTLNSSLQLDACGVCSGDGSTCKVERGSFNSSVYGYNDVLRIPAGATNINITQVSYDQNPRDDNYLALYDPVDHKYLLNGDFVVTMFEKTLNLDGSMLIEYTGADSVIERISTRSRPLLNDLIVKVLCVGKLLAPNIRYEYVINTHHSRDYIWKLEHGPCSSLCNGTISPQLQCVSRRTHEEVNRRHCSHMPEPNTQLTPCNTECQLKYVMNPPECPHCELEQPKCMVVERNKESQVNSSHCSGMRVPNYDKGRCLRSCQNSYVWRTTLWSRCSAKCGMGTTHRRVRCQTFSNGVLRIVPDEHCLEAKPETEAPCNVSQCGQWVIDAWSPCSVTCGDGVQKAAYACYLGETPLPHDYCQNSVKPKTVRTCTMSTPCPTSRIQREHKAKYSYTWKVGPWGKCSHACDGNSTGGIKLRQVVCHSENGTLSLECDKDTRPPHTANCTSDEPCPVWEPSKWSECEYNHHGYKNCTGLKTRQVKCRTLTSVISDNICYRYFKAKPVSQKCCSYRTNHHKSMYRWRVSQWSKCSCGDFVNKKRSVTCIHKKYGKPVDDSYCVKHASYRGQRRRPKTKRRCKITFCPFIWVTSSWSPCSSNCSYGLEKRSVTCHRQNSFGFIDPDPINSALCKETKPSEYNYCYLSDCDSKYIWHADPWPETCPMNCAKRWKRQKRKVRCVHKETGVRVPNSNCVNKHRPKRKRKCPCREQKKPSNCREMQQLHGVREDGDYALFIGNFKTMIYCHRMSTTSPLEYVSLKRRSALKNYSEIYGKRLLRPWLCPANGTRLESCDCIDDKSRRAGKTIFSKIRVNITNLAILDDWRFAMTEKEPISFGTGGDCYSSSMKCPQGSFNIDLRGTGFAVSPLTSWVAHGHKTVMNIHRSHHNEIVWGRCGGYCGTCSATQLKLQVI